VKRDAATVESDISAISAQVTKLNDDITTFSSNPTSLADALAIHTDATQLETIINTATTDTNASPAFSESDGNTILSDIETLQPLISNALTNLEAQHANFAKLPLAGSVALVESDLNTLNTDTTAFENALVAKAPADLLPTASSVISEINGAFQTAIATYSS